MLLNYSISIPVELWVEGVHFPEDMRLRRGILLPNQKSQREWVVSTAVAWQILTAMTTTPTSPYWPTYSVSSVSIHIDTNLLVSDTFFTPNNDIFKTLRVYSSSRVHVDAKYGTIFVSCCWLQVFAAVIRFSINDGAGASFYDSSLMIDVVRETHELQSCKDCYRNWVSSSLIEASSYEANHVEHQFAVFLPIFHSQWQSE